MDDLNREATPERKNANKALTLAIGGIAIAVIGPHVHIGRLLDLLITIAPFICEIMAVRYARKSLVGNDSSVVKKAKWARGIAYVILGLYITGIFAIPFLLFIDVNFALSLIAGILTILIIGAIFIFRKRKVWSKKKVQRSSIAIVVYAILIALYFSWINSLDTNKKHVQLFSTEHWGIIGERVGVSTQTPASPAEFTVFQEKYETTATLNEKLNSELLDSSLFNGSSSDIHQKFSEIINTTQDLQAAIIDLNPVVSEILAKYSDQLATADKENILVLQNLMKIQERRNEKVIEYGNFVLSVNFDSKVSTEQKQELSTLSKELDAINTELTNATSRTQ